MTSPLYGAFDSRRMYYYIVFYIIMASLTQPQEFVGYPIANLLNCDNKPANTNTAFFTYGRFQPGHRGHKKMIIALLNLAMKHNQNTGTEITPERTNVYVFVSPSGGIDEKDRERNPLTPNQKVHLLQEQYFEYPIHFINMGEAKAKKKRAGPGGAVKLLKQCYRNGFMFVGGDRIGAFDWLGNIMDITFKGVNRPMGAMSATAIRKAANMPNQTRQQTKAFESAIQFNAVTRSHVNEIKQIIRTSTERRRLRQLKKKKSKKIKGGKRKRKTRRKTRKNKTKRRKTKTKRKRKKRTLGRYTIRRKKK
jgi:hypothetical protein